MEFFYKSKQNLWSVYEQFGQRRLICYGLNLLIDHQLYIFLNNKLLTQILNENQTATFLLVKRRKWQPSEKISMLWPDPGHQYSALTLYRLNTELYRLPGFVSPHGNFFTRLKFKPLKQR